MSWDETKKFNQDLFDKFKNSLLDIDPVKFIEGNLTIDGSPFDISGGWKPFAEIYRYICLKAVDEGSKPVVLVKGRQVGATTMAAAIELYFMACGLYGSSGRPPMRIMHMFPTIGLAAAYSRDKFTTMVKRAKPTNIMRANGTYKSALEDKMDTTSPANDNLHFKKFKNDNQIWIEGTGLDGDRIRGRTVDCLFFDEVQDMTAQAIGTADKIGIQAKYGDIGQGIKVLFGTPKNKGGAYYKMWGQSSQQYFHLHCESCEKHFPLYRPDVNWEEIWLYGFIVKCTHCGHEQDKRKSAEKGRWIGLRDESDPDVKLIGYHINQLYIPTFTKEKIISQKPENSPTNTERIYMNEVLGEFFDGEVGTISKEEIISACLEKEAKFSSSIPVNSGKRVYAGFDWGGKAALEIAAGTRRGTSYSCAVILSVDSPELFSVEFAVRLVKNDFQAKLDIVEELFRRYSIDIAVGDIGYANDLTPELQRTYGDSFLASRACGDTNKKINYRDDIFPKEIMFDRNHHIEELISLLRRGNIKFPQKSYSRVEWLIDHCCSMDIKVTQNRSGDPVRTFVKGSGPNDGFMALLNAYLAWKFDVSNGFKIVNPNQMAMKDERSVLSPIIARSSIL